MRKQILNGAIRTGAEITFCRAFHGDFLSPDLVDEKYKNEWAPMAHHLIGEKNPVNPGTAQAVPHVQTKNKNEVKKMSQDFMKQIGLYISSSGNPPTLRIYGCGEILTLGRLEKKKDKSPDFAIMLGSMRVGSVWNKASANGKNYKTGTILNHLDLEKEIRFVIFPAKEKGQDHPVFLSQELDQSGSFDENAPPSSQELDSF